MYEEEFFNETSAGHHEGLPVLPFLPPTEEPSSVVLVISVALVGCLTMALCGNVSQIVLQIYTRRLKWNVPPQCFIAVLLFINFLVPLGLPTVILEELVRIWMFGRLSCHAHHILTTGGRVIIPWTIAMLHAFVALFLSRPNRLTRFEGVLTSFACASLILLLLVIVIPQGMAAELKLVRKDQIYGDKYIMLIHTFRCSLKPEHYPMPQMVKFGFEFAAPLLLSIYFQVKMAPQAKLKPRKAISKNLVYILIIHYFCNILCYIPEAKQKILFTILPEDVNFRQLLPYLSPTVIWYPLSQLSTMLSRCNSEIIVQNLLRSQLLSRPSETERLHLVTPQSNNEIS